MKKCKSCQSEIADKAKKCPKCQADQRNWFLRHKVMTAILALIVIVVIASAGSSKQSGTNQASNNPTATPKPKLDIAGFYAKVENGMTKDQVVALAAKDPGLAPRARRRVSVNTRYAIGTALLVIALSLLSAFKTVR